MLTRCADATQGSLCFPVAETLLQDAVLQPYIHNCQVTIYEGKHTYNYCVFFKWHCRLRTNVLLSDTQVEFRGDAVVMRLGVQPRLVVNMRARDAGLADYVVARSVDLQSRNLQTGL